MAKELLRPDLSGILVHPDGLKVNGSELVPGTKVDLPDSIVVTGGLAGDGARVQHTWVIQDCTPREGVISAVGFYGDHIRLGHGSRRIPDDCIAPRSNTLFPLHRRTTLLNLAKEIVYQSRPLWRRPPLPG